jgi:hypothetical protein
LLVATGVIPQPTFSALIARLTFCDIINFTVRLDEERQALVVKKNRPCHPDGEVKNDRVPTTSVFLQFDTALEERGIRYMHIMIPGESTR